MSSKTTIIMIDASGSMRGARGDAVNQAMKELQDVVFPEVLANAGDEINLEQYVGVIRFGDDIQWIVDPSTSMENFIWTPIDDEEFYGQTPTGEAIANVVDRLSHDKNGDSVSADQLAPSILLISDGEPNGDNPTYEDALSAALQNNLFRRANRIAIAVSVSDSGRESLKKFGRLSNSLKEQGYEPYMDVADDKTSVLVEIIKRVTQGLSQEVPTGN